MPVPSITFAPRIAGQFLNNGDRPRADLIKIELQHSIIVSMQYKTFIIPADTSEMQEKALNTFLSVNKIISVQKEFVNSPSPAWCFLVEFVDDASANSKSSKIDYMKILSSEEFAVFTKLREIRKKIAADEKIPPYVIFTDEQLSKIVKTQPKDISDLGKINGVGIAKAEKYGQKFIEAMNTKQDGHKTDEKSDVFDIF